MSTAVASSSSSSSCAPPSFGGGRIPAALQAIFMASNAGHEVYTPPTDKSANRVFGKETKPVMLKYGGNLAAKKRLAHVPPQAKFHLKLKERGYFPRNYCAKRSGYYNAPTEHQLASYGSEMLAVVKQNRVQEFRRLLECGLSPNACNAHGESLLHMVCRHGKEDLFHILVAYEVDVQQTDDYGRTALHDACWAAHPSFEIARWLLLRDPALMSLFDARGSLPLSYVTKSLWGEWNTFLDSIMDNVFPADSPLKDVTPELVTMKPHSRPVPDPKHKIPTHIATQVANGTMQPYQALALWAAEDADETVMTGEDDDYSLDDDSSSYDSEDDDDSDFDSDEEEELYQMVGHVQQLGTVGEEQEDEQ